MIRKFIAWWFGFDKEIHELRQDLHKAYMGEKINIKYYLGDWTMTWTGDNKPKKRKKK